MDPFPHAERYVHDSEEEVINRSTTLITLKVEDLESTRDLPFIEDFNRDDLEAVLMEADHEPLTEPLHADVA